MERGVDGEAGLNDVAGELTKNKRPKIVDALRDELLTDDVRRFEYIEQRIIARLGGPTLLSNCLSTCQHRSTDAKRWQPDIPDPEASQRRPCEELIKTMHGGETPAGISGA
jgi:hypothetical protein